MYEGRLQNKKTMSVTLGGLRNDIVEKRICIVGCVGEIQEQDPTDCAGKYDVVDTHD